jgi:hypothetical protein
MINRTPIPCVWNAEWKYTSSKDTDIRKTFAKHGFKPIKKGRRNARDLDNGRTGRQP